MKYKALIILLVLILFTSGYAMAYSFFRSDADLDTEQAIAKFIFNTESLDELQLSLSDLKPGDNKDYVFSVSNNSSGNTSDISLEYQMIIKTYHFIPLLIELYKVDGENEELIFACDETYARNEKNELVCETPIQDMEYSLEEIDDYKLKVEFPNEYNDAIYSDLTDYLNIEIKSWQK